MWRRYFFPRWTLVNPVCNWLLLFNTAAEGSHRPLVVNQLMLSPLFQFIFAKRIFSLDYKQEVNTILFRKDALFRSYRKSWKWWRRHYNTYIYILYKLERNIYIIYILQELYYLNIIIIYLDPPSSNYRLVYVLWDSFDRKILKLRLQLVYIGILYLYDVITIQCSTIAVIVNLN